MNRFPKISALLLYLLFSVFLGCEDYEKEYHALQHENDSLKNVIDSILSSPAKLYEEAWTFIDSVQYDSANSKLLFIQQRYPAFQPDAVELMLLYTADLAKKKSDSLISINEFQKQSREILFSAVDSSFDEFRNVTIYKLKNNISKKINKNSYSITIYILKTEKSYKYFRLLTEYEGKEELNYHKIVFTAAEEVLFTIENRFPEKQIETKGNKIYEWSDNLMQPAELKKIRPNPPLEITFVGDLKATISLSAEDINNILIIRNLFQNL